MLSQLNKVIKINWKDKKLIFSSLLLLSFFAGFTYFFFNNGNVNKVIGVQIVTNKGSFLIGKDNRYAKSFSIWFSPLSGWFDREGKANFFEIKHKKEKLSKTAWEIVWEWDELYKIGEKSALIRFVPDQEQKDTAIETLSSLCSDRKENSPSCQWNISNHIFLEAFSQDFICVSDLQNEFYGGAHPIALRRFGTFDFINKKFVRFDEFISDSKIKEEIWSQLNENIKAILEQTMLDNSFNNSVGGMDTFTGPANDSAKNQTSQQKLTGLLNSQGYTFSPNVFCPAIKPNGPFLLFGFPHSEQVNRGLNFRAETLLNQAKLPKKVIKLFEDYKFVHSEKDQSIKMMSKDSQWQILQNISNLEIVNKTNKIKLVLPDSEDSTEQILGIFWIYKSPNLEELKAKKFTKIQISQNQKIVNLNKIL